MKVYTLEVSHYESAEGLDSEFTVLSIHLTKEGAENKMKGLNSSQENIPFFKRDKYCIEVYEVQK